MIEINKIPKLSIKSLQSIKDLSVQDINSIINTAKLFKYNNKEKDKAVPCVSSVIKPSFSLTIRLVMWAISSS